MQLKTSVEACCRRAAQKVQSRLEQARTAQAGIIDDEEMARIARYQEYGWVQRVTPRQAGFLRAQLGTAAPKAGASLVLPPRPVFRATAQAHAKDWAQVFAAGVKHYGALEADKALQLVAMRAADDLKATLVRGGTTQEQFARRSPLTMRLMAAQSRGRRRDGGGNTDTDRPLIRTGGLLNSISWQLT